MKAVGIKQLKARLSEYIRLARSGEIILVSDRDEVVAELGPPRHQAAQPDSHDAVLDRLAERGWVTRASASKAGWSWSPPSLDMPPRTVDAVLSGLREDR